MTARIIPVKPFDYVVFGGSGDLAMRKLFPSLYYRECDGQLPEAGRIIGASRRQLSDEDYRAQVHAALQRHIPADYWDETAWQRFAQRLFYLTIDATDPKGFAALAQQLEATRERAQVFYLATAPALYASIAAHLAAVGLNQAQSRLVLEKPIGQDLASSRAINQSVGEHFDEHQVYRIDHYLGKESVQNLLALRFGNLMFERLWSSAQVDHVQISVAESIGLGSRAGYYDEAGALRDMVQNHLLQLLCLTAMEPPTSLEADAVRDEKLKVLRALRPITAANVAQLSVRGQYGDGAVNGEAVPSYAKELGRQSQTETFVALTVHVDNWRWSGVPFYLRTGKRLARRYSEVMIALRPVPHSVFGDEQVVQQNRLLIRLQPDEGVSLHLMTKEPGPGGMRLRAAPLDLSFSEEYAERTPGAYERLLLDVVRGAPTLFMRNDEVEAAWAWIEPILEGWKSSGEAPRSYASGSYTSGSMGPTDSTLLIGRDGRRWHEDMA